MAIQDEMTRAAAKAAALRRVNDMISQAEMVKVRLEKDQPGALAIVQGIAREAAELIEHVTVVDTIDRSQ